MRTDWDNLKAGDVVQARNGQRFTIGQVITRDLPIDFNKNTRPCVIAACQERFAEDEGAMWYFLYPEGNHFASLQSALVTIVAEAYSLHILVVHRHHLTPSAITKDLFNKVYSQNHEPKRVL